MVGTGESGREPDDGGLRVGIDVPPLAEAKLAAPSQRAGTLSRPRILRALDAGEDSALTLVAAPPGYGKSTAVREWVASRDTAFAWVTLDEGDNDPVRLWRYVTTAVGRVLPGVPHPVLRRLSVTGAPIEVAIDELANGIAIAKQELVVVLDDLQKVTNLDCLASLEYCLARLPKTARIVVMTRVDPPLNVAGLRGRSNLTELRADELAFTADEARQTLLDRGRLELDDDDIELLLHRTEGWPAALTLATFWLRKVDDVALAVHRFGADQRFIADYLSHEVLSSLDDDLRTFLLRVSVLGRFTPELCDAVLERSDSASLLAELEQATLFISRLERGRWYRVHSLFADFATWQLEAIERAAPREIHGRAAAYLRAHAMPVEAAEHAVIAGDEALIAEILVDHHLTFIRTGGAHSLLRWVHTLSDTELIRHPELAAAGATAAAMVGGRALDRRRLLALTKRAEAERPELFGRYADAVAGMVVAASVDDDVGEAVINGRRAVQAAERSADEVLVAALAGHARALYFAGELDTAWAQGKRAIEHPEAERRTPGHAFARATLALVAVEQGRHRFARVHAEKAKALMGGNGTSRSWLGANAAAALGSVLFAEGSLVDAERELAFAEHFFADEVATLHYAWLLVLLARVRCERGRLHEAQATIEMADEAIAELRDCGRVPDLAEQARSELARARARANGGEILEPPSEAELAVLDLLSSDLSAREIGVKLFLSPNTIRSHTRSIYRKLGVTSREAAVARATATGLLKNWRDRDSGVGSRSPM
jgi:LuxR family transcriptional regulator, maltose regulon positive regulatory protein